MAAQTAPIPLLMLPPCGLSFAQSASSIGTNGSLAFDGATDRVAWIFQATSTTIPDAVDFHINAVTTVGTTGNIEGTIETLDSSGNPSGTAVTSSATGTLTYDGTTGYKQISGMAGTATLTAGTMYAVVLTSTSGWDRNVTMTLSLGNAPGLGNPYAAYRPNGSGWTKLATNTAGYLNYFIGLSWDKITSSLARIMSSVMYAVGNIKALRYVNVGMG